MHRGRPLSGPWARRCQRLLIALAAMQLAGCDLSPGAPGVRWFGITDGITDTGHPSVGLLTVPLEASGKVGTCTATLVSAEWVLTAAHCLKPGMPQTFQIGTTTCLVKRVVVHPGFDPAATVIPPENDIGLALLDRVVAVPLIPVSVSPVAPGAGLVLVGLGVSGEGATDAGEKRTATNVVKEVLPTRFSIVGSGAGVGNFCKGDSGGPAFGVLGKQQVQVGVASAIEGLCGSSTVWATRVDAYRDWLLAMAAGEILLPDTQPPRVSVTFPREGAIVAPLLTVRGSAIDDRKLAEVTLSVDQQLRATGAEAAFSFVVDLVPGRHRLRVKASDAAGNEGWGEVEVEAVSGPRAYGEPCAAASDCSSGLCLLGDDNSRYCSQACDATTRPCPSEVPCLETGDDGPACAPPPVAPGPPPSIEGGCAVGSRSRSGVNAWLWAALLLGASSRRRAWRGASPRPSRAGQTGAFPGQ